MKIKLMYLACALSLIIATSCGANSKKARLLLRIYKLLRRLTLMRTAHINMSMRKLHSDREF